MNLFISSSLPPNTNDHNLKVSSDLQLRGNNRRTIPFKTQCKHLSLSVHSNKSITLRCERNPPRTLGRLLSLHALFTMQRSKGSQVIVALNMRHRGDPDEARFSQECRCVAEGCDGGVCYSKTNLANWTVGGGRGRDACGLGKGATPFRFHGAGWEGAAEDVAFVRKENRIGKGFSTGALGAVSFLYYV